MCSAHAVRGFGLYQSPDRVLDPALRELGQTRAGWLVGSQFVFSQHCKSCRALGMDEAKIEAIRSWPVASCFDARSSAPCSPTPMPSSSSRAGSTTTCSTILQAQLSDEEILELTYITAMYAMHAVISRALRLEFDDRDDPVVEVAAPEGAAARDVGADISLAPREG